MIEKFHTRHLLSLFLILAVCYILGPILWQYSGFDYWVEMSKDDRIITLVENALYVEETSPYFFIHVKIVNQTDKIVGSDFKSYGTFFPDAMGTKDNLFQGEMWPGIHALPAKLDESLRQKELEVYRTKDLKFISPKGSIDYYINFNGTTHQEIQQRPGKYIALGIRGQMFFSDNFNVWDENGGTHLYIPKSTKWKEIPKETMVILN